MTLAALKCIDSKALNSFLLVAHPQIGSAYVIEGKMTSKYWSNSVLLGKARELLISFSLLTNPLSMMCLDHVSLLSIVTPNNLECVVHFM